MQRVDTMSAGERELFLDAATRGARYLAGIGDRSVAPDERAIERLPSLGGPLGAKGLGGPAVLALLDEVGSRGTIANSGGRYFGYVNGGSLPAARAASVLSLAWDQNAALRSMSPTAAVLEDVTGGWLLDMLGLPATASFAFVSGATMASFTGLAAARHALLSRAGWDVESMGLFDAPRLNVVVGEEVHVSVMKALGLLGLGRERVVRLPSDAQGRMRADALPPLDELTIVCTQAGNVNSGSFDPFEEICDRAARARAWVHVDGAFGLWAAAAPSLAPLVRGVSRADSWATDAHKWLNVPYDCGLAFVRDAAAHQRAMQLQPAAYLAPDSLREPAHWTPEASRRARAVEVWAALRSLGRDGVAEMIGRSCAQARRFAAGLRAAGYEVLNDVSINQVLVSFGRDDATRRVIEAVQRDGTSWCGASVWRGRAVMRISVSSWATTDEDVDGSLGAMISIARAS
jgi:glutamate/tyrosine decarboxylase-like PLP-dependent enzyme